MIKRILFFLTFLSVFVTMRAQYNSINFDYQTAAIMLAEYNAAAAAEMYYDEQVKDILEKYGIAEVAAAGIYTSKHLDRQALTSLGEWSSPTENHYYRRIYHLVSVKIIPELWDLSSLLLRYPHKAIYWGSYLAKTCTEVKSLCQQFESVVTNGTLSFSDINFLELNPQVAAMIQLSKMGDVDWKAMLEGMSYVGLGFTKENLTNDLESFYTAASSIASSGYSNFVSDLMGNSEFSGTFIQKAADVCEVAQNAYDIYKDADGNMVNLLRQYWGETPTAADLFNFANYDMASWVSDYLAQSSDMFYTQRYYIANKSDGNETVCSYSPPRDNNAILSSGEWIRFTTSDPSFWPSPSQLEQVLANSEQYAGWSRNLVSTLNNQNNGIKYSITYSLENFSITSNGRQTKKAFAFSIQVVKSWHIEETVYEEIFDSFSMDLPTFISKMNGYLAEYNENEEGIVYELLHDEKHYYEAASEAKVKGCESAIITLTCTDDMVLGEGSTKYKCGTCGKTLNAHSKECAMKTTLSSDEDDLNISELQSRKEDLERQIASKQSQLTDLLYEKGQLEERLVAYPDKNSSIYSQMEAELSSINASIAALRQEISSLNVDLDKVMAAITEAENEPMETDDYYRIPAIMQDVQTLYGLSWQGAGWWSGYSYYRYATCPTLRGTVTFQATLSIDRKPSYFLGIKIHRAILKISWKLSVTYTDTQIVDNLTFDSETSDEEKAGIINDRLSELARDFPSCTASVEYVKVEDDEVDDDTDDTQHLLWSSDRLAIARQVEARLMHIYADIVSMKKMMHYRLDILDVLNTALPYLDTESGRRHNMADRCRRRWLRNAADRHHSISYNGKYEIDDEETD